MKDKRIYIDARWEKMGGIGTFYKEINKKNKYHPLHLSGNPTSPLDVFRTFFALKKLKNAIVFFPGYIPPLFSKVPFVLTLHDLNHIDRNENSSFIKRMFYKTMIKRGCRNASYIFTVSEFSKKRIINWAGVEEEKVVNVSNGVSERFTPYGPRMDYDFEYFLCVSNRKKHKNEIGTLKAFKQANLKPNMRLVFTGKADVHILKAIEELNLKDKVVFTGYLSDDDLPKLYRSAKALIFVSFYEGFGLPIIEAQASGIPVITSYGSSLDEISGDSALNADAEDIAGISKLITEICTNEVLVSDVIEKGYLNAKKYTWNRTAEKIDSILKSI